MPSIYKPTDHFPTPWTFHNTNNPDYIDIDSADGDRVTTISLEVDGIAFEGDDTPELEIARRWATARMIVESVNLHGEALAYNLTFGDGSMPKTADCRACGGEGYGVEPGNCPVCQGSGKEGAHGV